ncbi:MAG: hypothetical protein FJ288_02315 [Planctomycetes bacterium]|nr:hypothetical protein [Planctomycetota bacterium]
MVVADAVPALVDRRTWERAQEAVKKRTAYKGGAGKQTNRWLLSGVLRCGDCGHPYWGELKRKRHIEGRKDIATKYYTCAGRRTHGNMICTGSSHIQAEALEEWVLSKLRVLVFADTECVEAAIEKFVAAATSHQGGNADVEKVAQEIEEIDATVNALTMNIDPANLTLLNDRLTLLRRRKEHLCDALRQANASNPQFDEGALRRWAVERIQGLADALDGRRDEKMRQVVAAYVDRIVATPSTKTGYLALTPAAYGLYKQNDRPEGRSWVNVVAGAGFEPATFGL